MCLSNRSFCCVQCKYIRDIIIIIMSCREHGFPWFSLCLSLSLPLPVRLYLPSHSVSLSNYILCLFRAVIDKILTGRPTPACTCEGYFWRTSLMSSPLILQQCHAWVVRLIWMILEIGGRWPYNCCFVGCGFQNLFNMVH